MRKLRGRGRGRARYAALAAAVVIAGIAAVVGLDPFDPGSSESSRAADRSRPAVGNASGELDRLVNDLVRQMSRNEVFRRPRAGDVARHGRSFRALRAGRLNRAAVIARPLGYRVIRYRDTDTGRRLVLLAEQGPRRRGWGLYVHSPTSRSKQVVEVSHPGSDIKSELIGVETFRRANASDLLVAGALRDAAPDDAADAAHAPSGPFEAVHRATIKAGVTVVQPHGFDEGERDRQYGEIVVSSGAAPTARARSLAERLRAAGFDTCLYEPGRCEGLAGTTNVQGQSARTAGAEFVHVELARRLRESRRVRNQLASIFAAVLARR